MYMDNVRFMKNLRKYFLFHLWTIIVNRNKINIIKLNITCHEIKKNLNIHETKKKCHQIKKNLMMKKVY